MADPLAWLTELEGVPSAYAAARDGVDSLLRDRGLRRTTPADTARSLLVGAHASAVLAGSSATLSDVEHGEGDAPARAAVRVSSELLGLAPMLRRAPLHVFARVHALAGEGDDLGRPRDAAAAERLRLLADTLGATEAPAMLLAALVHAEIATLTPFGSYDDIVARALERLVLVAKGVDPASVVVPEAGHLMLRAAYESNLRAYAGGTREGVQAWLLYAAEAYAAGAEASPLART